MAGPRLNLVTTLCDRLVRLSQRRGAPVMVALDGRSGVGKSTLAAETGRRLGAVVIDGDDFYAGGTDEEWDALTPAEQVARCIDWRRQRPLLEALAGGRSASWQRYDWDADDGSLDPCRLTSAPAAIVVLEGAYSARVELADLLDLRVLLDTRRHVRRQRLLEREGEHHRAEWEARWAASEDLYFTDLMPPEAFDLVLVDPA